ncbi:reticulon-like protein B21 [Andrographis paniculata]|uniref:reticulon-like protein B21 n=1 Tax=Andrographis paniculata TaxID=175694 RepID=UPI0021E8E52B|nr:reticulon-like protein B21 [Andrographis paniculata]
MMSTTKEAMAAADGGSRRRGTTGPKAGSVWESRMKLDQVKGGIKIKAFDAIHDGIIAHSTPRKSSATASPEPQIDKGVIDSDSDNARPKQGAIGLSGKRKTWKSENPEGSPSPIIQIARQRSESGQQVKEVAVCGDDEMNDSETMKSEPSDGNSLDQLVTELEKKLPDELNEVRSEHRHFVEKEAISSNVNRRIKPPSDGGGVGGSALVVKEVTSQEPQKPKKKAVAEEKKLIHSNAKPVKIPASHVKLRRPIPSKSSPDEERSSPEIPRTSGKLQSFVDLVMWRDASKSAFVFGIGTFAIISSSFTNDLNISFISVVSYLGLVYLAANFIFRSLISRGSIEVANGSNEEYVIGEEEAIRVTKMFLPYLNEFLVNLKDLFSGDPATTMKLAVMLFALAQCGGSITIWKVVKLGFFGVFIVPKLCCTYSSRMTAQGSFWVRRFSDAWKSCSHKKIVGFVVFTAVWNLASLIARIWMAFMLVVVIKYYQQSSPCTTEEARSPADTGKQNKVS